VSRPTCYSDHNRDIDTVYECTVCGGTDRDGTSEGRHVREEAPDVRTTLADVLPVFREVVEQQSMRTPIIDGGEVIVDLQTANVACQVYDLLGTEARAKADTMPVMKFVGIAWKLASR
jgi:hypothetical protein